MKQYFFLVVANYDESTFPKKIFFNQDQAENYAKKLAKELGNNYDVSILRQEMCKSGTFTHFKTYYSVV